MSSNYVVFQGTGFTGASDDVLDELPEWVHKFHSTDPDDYKRKFSQNFSKYLKMAENPLKIDNLTLKDLESCRGVVLPFHLEHDDTVTYGMVTKQTPVIHNNIGSIEIEGHMDQEGYKAMRRGHNELSLGFKRIYQNGKRGAVIFKEYSMCAKGKRDGCKLRNVGYRSNNSELANKINYEEDLSNFKNKIYEHEVKLSIKFEEKNKMAETQNATPEVNGGNTGGQQPITDSTKTETKTESTETEKISGKRMREIFLGMPEDAQELHLLRTNKLLENIKNENVTKLASFGLDTGKIPDFILENEILNDIMSGIEKKYIKDLDEKLKKYAEQEKPIESNSLKKKGNVNQANKLEGILQETISVNSGTVIPRTFLSSRELSELAKKSKLKYMNKN